MLFCGISCTCMYVIYVYIYTCMYIYVDVYVHIHLYVCIYVCTCLMYGCTNLCIYVCLYLKWPGVLGLSVINKHLSHHLCVFVCVSDTCCKHTEMWKICVKYVYECLHLCITLCQTRETPFAHTRTRTPKPPAHTDTWRHTHTTNTVSTWHPNSLNIHM